MRTGTRTFTLLAVALLASACARQTSTSTRVDGTPVVIPVPAPAGAYEPAGKWSIALVAQGQAMELTMNLVKNPDGSYGGTFTSDMFPPMPISTAKLEGNKMVLTLAVPTGDMATMNMTFNGDLVEGDWTMPGDGSKLSGKRI
jgi:hypothetical protein